MEFWRIAVAVCIVVGGIAAMLAVTRYMMTGAIF